MHVISALSKGEGGREGESEGARERGSEGAREVDKHTYPPNRRARGRARKHAS